MKKGFLMGSIFLSVGTVFAFLAWILVIVFLHKQKVPEWIWIVFGIGSTLVLFVLLSELKGYGFI
jgi:ABC-type xylose transport system permease subunit